MARNMPTGVEVAPLGWRLLGWVIDLSVPLVLNLVLYFLLGSMGASTEWTVLAIIVTLLQLGWALLLWWGYATRGAGIGFQVAKLQVVGLKDGKPIGWWRFFVRQLVFSALLATVVGGIALAIFLIIHERRQGWHDMAGKSVAIRRRGAAAKAATASQQRPKGHSTTVALPPHLIAAAFDPARSAGATPQVDAAQQAWQASQFGGGTASQAGGWQPPTAPGGANPSQPAVQSPAASAYQQPAQSMPPQSMPPQSMPPQQPQQGMQPTPPVSQSSAPSMPPQLSQSAHSTQLGSPMQPGGPLQPGGPVSAPAVPPQWAPPAAAQNTFETTVRPRGSMTDDDEFGGTRMVAGPSQAGGRPMTEGWYLRLDDGRMIPVNGVVLLGRNPSSAEGAQATLVPVGENGHTVSKTHLAVGVDQRGVHVTDRGSTNGTALVNAKGELEPCLPGIQARVRDGQVVSFGDHSFTVMRRPVEG